MTLLKCCPRCGEKENIVKCGKRRDKQCYQCKKCNRQFTETKRADYPLEIRYIALKLIYAQVCYRNVAQILSIKKHTLISYWSKTIKLSELKKEINKNKTFEIAKRIESQIIVSNEVEKQKMVVSHIKLQLKYAEEKTATSVQHQVDEEALAKDNKELKDLKQQLVYLENHPEDVDVHNWYKKRKNLSLEIGKLERKCKENKTTDKHIVDVAKLYEEFAFETDKLNRLKDECELKLDRYIATETLDVLDEIINDFA